jgi:diguanylate cyclase (GGDEF)-like protein
MFEHGRRLNETIEVDELIQQMIEASKEFFNARYACLYIKEGKKYRMVKDSGTNQRHEVPVELHMEEANVHIIKSNMIRVPIKYEGHDWGCLSIYDKRSDIGEMQQKVFFPFQEEDYEVLTVYTEQVMFKMKHAVLLKKYHNLANNDFLTGIPNRRFFMKQFEYLVERAKRGDELTVMIIDIDKFKNFNDHYGHDTGDEALKLVARTLQECLRKIDIIGRFGGEEFAALLPNTNGHDEMIAERIRKRIKDMPFIDTITVSIGVSVFGRDGTTEHELLTKADKALYHSKANGRDQVSYYRSDME